MKVGALLTISVEYNVPGGYTLEEARDEILGLLDYVAQHAANEGLLSGDTELTVDKWWNRQVIVVEPAEDCPHDEVKHVLATISRTGCVECAACGEKLDWYEWARTHSKGKREEEGA